MVYLRWFLLSVVFLAHSSLFASSSYLDYLEDTSLTDVLKENYKFEGSKADFEKAKALLWQKFVSEREALKVRKAEHEARALKWEDKTMRFDMKVKPARHGGKKPLYIALHGGGQTHPRVNDSQWNHMKIYYWDSVKEGVYVAARGITNNWNLHFEEESYPLYDKLIENMILFENVDPNRVYLTGFSAGGDGVYQITPRMSDRWAAANMSAGHHNWVTFDNLYNTPFLIQMGEYDRAYKRNRVAAENHLKLNELQSQYGGGFVHDLYLHVGGSHNSWQDNDAREREYSVIKDARGWLEERKRDSKRVNSNAITWMDQHIRNPLPLKLVWDLKVGASKRVSSVGADWLKAKGEEADVHLAAPKSLFYWLNAEGFEESEGDQARRVVAHVDRGANAVVFDELEGLSGVKVYLHPDMVDFSRPVSLKLKDKVLGVWVPRGFDTNVMAKTMLERGDPSWSFAAAVTLSRGNNSELWELN